MFSSAIMYIPDNWRKAARKVVDLFWHVSLNDYLSKDGKKWAFLVFFYNKPKNLFFNANVSRFC